LQQGGGRYRKAPDKAKGVGMTRVVGTVGTIEKRWYTHLKVHKLDVDAELEEQASVVDLVCELRNNLRRRFALR
jgi:hypothetical protein